MTTEEKTVSSPFEVFGLDPIILSALDALEFEEPTPVQEQAIPLLMEGRDIIARARTGSGKTAAFGLPLLERLKVRADHVRALVLAPTRELALQVTEAIKSYGKGLRVRLVTVYGGASYTPQIRSLDSGMDIVVGTPGRLIDLMERGILDLSKIEVVVIDEADEMLRMGFIDDVETLLAKTPKGRQVALFSATMPPIMRKVAQTYLTNPVEVSVETSALSVDHVDQRWMRVPQQHKIEGVLRILESEPRGPTLIFARTRADCADAADILAKNGLSAEALHGDLPQSSRERVLGRFRAGVIQIIVATDIAARGIDVEGITHVINLDLPKNIESYVHRVGRTGRAGRAGLAITLVTPAEIRRVNELSHRLKVVIAEQQVPSNAQIIGFKRGEVVSEMFNSEAPVSEELVAWMESLKEEHDLESLALQALRLLAADRNIHIESKPDPRPPSWARGGHTHHKVPSGRRDAGSQREQRPSHKSTNEVEIFIPLGKQRGLRPQDVVGALANEVGITGDSIGRIEILERKTFVGLPKEIAELVLQRAPMLAIRGTSVRLSMAFNDSEGGPRTERSAPRDTPPPRKFKSDKRPFTRKPGRGKKAP